MATKVFGNMMVPGKQTIWIPASAFTPRATGGATPDVHESSVNKVGFPYLAFDFAAPTYANFSVQMPNSWDGGNMFAKFVWMHPLTTGDTGVRWAIKAASFANGTLIDSAYGAEAAVTDTGGTTFTQYTSPETGAIVASGPSDPLNLVVFEIKRDTAHAGDLMGVEAYLIGVQIIYTAGVGDDA